MRSMFFSAGLTLLMASTASAADLKAAADGARKDIQDTFGFLPDFLKRVPDHAIAGAWEEMRGIEMNSLTAVPAKYKELIALAVAAQAPCERSVHLHTQFAKLHGATDDEIAEAVMLGAVSRHWSVFVNGLQQDEGKFRAELTKVVAGVKKNGGSSVEVVDDKTALADITHRFGIIPEAMRQFPAEGRAGAWKQRRDLELASDTAIPPKYKVLISLAVAAQVPCSQCIVADTAFGAVAGVSEREMRESVAIASLVRHWSTWLTGMQIDPASFRRDVDRMVRELKRGVPRNNPS